VLDALEQKGDAKTNEVCIVGSLPRLPQHDKFLINYCRSRPPSTPKWKTTTACGRRNGKRAPGLRLIRKKITLEKNSIFDFSDNSVPD
jgi:hypothetical protein